MLVLTCGFKSRQPHHFPFPISASGGIGRLARFRFWCPLRTCGFKSRLAHQFIKNPDRVSPGSDFFILFYIIFYNIFNNFYIIFIIFKKNPRRDLRHDGRFFNIKIFKKYLFYYAFGTNQRFTSTRFPIPSTGQRSENCHTSI